MIWLVLLLPLCVPLAAAWIYKTKRSLGEYIVHLVITVVITCGVFYAGKYFPALDKEVHNGYVVNKSQVYNPRTEYYDCRCTKKGCDTCSRTIPEWDWTVFTNVGNLNINRIDGDGRREPPRWTRVKIGEAAAIEKTYINQIKAAKDSIFHFDMNLIRQYEDKVPEYPSVTDYYRINHVINMSKDVDTKGWNDYINNRLKTLGKSKQLNVIIVVTDYDYAFFDALKYKWLGGKKNDVVMVIGQENKKVKWFASTSLADGYKNQTLHSTLRMNAHDKNIDANFLIDQFNIIEKEFVRTPMEEFNYLTSDSEPPGWVMILAVVLGVVASIAVSLGIQHFSGFNFNRRYRF